MVAVVIGFACLIAAAGYSALNLVAIQVWRLSRRRDRRAGLPPVTILKPLCGAEPGLYADLRSFCAQDYPEFQIVFGIRDENDPARTVAARLAAEFPSLPITLVIDPQLHGSNRKVSNLINMLPHARHEIILMADSDAFVRPDYLRTVTAPLRDARVGLVTCVYRGTPTLGIWSRIGAMYINEWYVPSILLAWLFGHQGFVSGQTVCIRQETLRAVGGLPALANHLADDHRLGTLVRGLGLRIELSSYVVTGEHHEPSLDEMTSHEMRWMSTLRVLRPRSFPWLFVTFSVPLGLLGFALVASRGNSLPALMLLGVTLLLRLTLHLAHRLRGAEPLLSDLWLVPARDLLLCWVWMRCFFTSRITWRGTAFDVDADGVMRPLS